MYNICAIVVAFILLQTHTIQSQTNWEKVFKENTFKLSYEKSQLPSALLQQAHLNKDSIIFSKENNSSTSQVRLNWVAFNSDYCFASVCFFQKGMQEYYLYNVKTNKLDIYTEHDGDGFFYQFKMFKEVYLSYISRPYPCGAFFENKKQIEEHYNTLYKHLNCKSDESIASIGAKNAVDEILISSYNNNIHWTLQDKNIECLDSIALNKQRIYFSKIRERQMDSDFKFLIGPQSEKMLLDSSYDKVLLLKCHYQEMDSITRRNLFLGLVNKLKPNGKLILFEKMANQKTKTTNYGATYVPEAKFINDMKSFSFTLKEKITLTKPYKGYYLYIFYKTAL